MDRIFVAYRAGKAQERILSKLLGREVKIADFIGIAQSNKTEKDASDKFIAKEGWLDKKIKDICENAGSYSETVHNWAWNAIGDPTDFDMVFPPARCKFEVKNGEIDTSRLNVDTHITTKLKDCVMTLVKSVNFPDTKQDSVGFLKKMQQKSDFPSFDDLFDYIDEMKEEYGDDIDHIVSDETIAEAWKRVSKNKLNCHHDGLDCYMIDEWEDLYQVGNNPKFTSWCVAENTEDYGHDYFDQYGPPYYMIARGHEPVALLNPSSNQFKDADDQPYYGYDCDESVVAMGFKVLEEIGCDYDGEEDFSIFVDREDLNPYADDYNGESYEDIAKETGFGREKKDEDDDGIREIDENIRKDPRFYLGMMNDKSFYNERNASYILLATAEHGGDDVIAEMINVMGKVVRNPISKRFYERIVHYASDFSRVLDSLDEFGKRMKGMLLPAIVNDSRCDERTIRKIYGDEDIDHDILMCIFRSSECPRDILDDIVAKNRGDEELMSDVGIYHHDEVGLSDVFADKIIGKMKDKDKVWSYANCINYCNNFSDSVWNRIVGESKGCSDESIEALYDAMVKSNSVSEDTMVRMLEIHKSSKAMQFVKKSNCTPRLMNMLFEEFGAHRMKSANNLDYAWFKKHIGEMSDKSLVSIYREIGDDYIHYLLWGVPNCPYEVMLSLCKESSFPTFDFIEAVKSLKVSRQTAERLFDDGAKSIVANDAFPIEDHPELLGNLGDCLNAFMNGNCPKEWLQERFDSLIGAQKEKRGVNERMQLKYIVSNPSFKPEDMSKLKDERDYDIDVAILMNGTYDESLVLKIADGYLNVNRIPDMLQHIFEIKSQSLKEKCIRMVDDAKWFVDAVNTHVSKQMFYKFIAEFKDVETLKWLREKQIIEKTGDCNHIRGKMVFDAVMKNPMFDRDFIVEAFCNYGGRDMFDTNETYAKGYVERFGVDGWIVRKKSFCDDFGWIVENPKSREQCIPLLLANADSYNVACSLVAMNRDAGDTTEALIKGIGKSMSNGDVGGTLLTTMIDNGKFTKEMVDRVLDAVRKSFPNWHELVCNDSICEYAKKYGIGDVVVEYVNAMDGLAKEDYDDDGNEMKHYMDGIDIDGLSREDILKVLKFSNNGVAGSLVGRLKKRLRDMKKRMDKERQSSGVRASVMAGRLIAGYAKMSRIATRIAMSEWKPAVRA